MEIRHIALRTPHLRMDVRNMGSKYWRGEGGGFVGIIIVARFAESSFVFHQFPVKVLHLPFDTLRYFFLPFSLFFSLNFFPTFFYHSIFSYDFSFIFVFYARFFPHFFFLSILIHYLAAEYTSTLSNAARFCKRAS